ncbi:MAG: alpha-2-macroglobulin family protein [Taibaiella sp.]|jgi:uncharacterized protein YfaS (alpha-2-macroglobulin family)
MLHRFFAIIFLISFSIAGFAQKNKMNNNYASEWSKVDSFRNKGLPKSAITIAQGILKDALAKKDSPNAIKANLFLMSADASTEDEAGIDNIKKAEAFTATASGAEKAIWQSIAAQMYWNYFQQNRWKFYSRTAMAETKSDDIDTWDPPAYFRKISALYQTSIENREALKAIPVAQYAPIIIEGMNTRYLRPSLYDLLVFRAISFFENDEKDVINPADQFQIDGTLWFESAERFCDVKVKVSNAESLHFQALRLYQEIIGYHLHDPKPDALIDADLQRLTFVHNNSVNPSKDSLYLKALQQLESKYQDNPAVAQVSYLIAVQLMGNEQPPRTYGRKIPGNAKVKLNRDLPAVKTRLQSIITKYPGTEGAVNAYNLIQSLEQVFLEVKTEEVNIPDENIKALISYKNTGTAYLKLYRIPSEVNSNQYQNNDELLKELTKLKPVRSWTQALPGSEDMEQHNTEVKVDALPIGSYVILASVKAELSAGENIISASRFQVSALSFIMEQDAKKGHILNRKTGYPVPDIKGRFWSQKYNNKQNRYEPKLISTSTGNKDGMIDIPATETGNYENRLNAITLMSGADTLQVGGYFNNYYRNDEGVVSARHTFFFTDRSIYRPGQTIYFKGIMLQSNKGGRDNQVLANEKTTVTFYDVNGQKISSLDLTSNEFGSFQGKFTAPEGLLGGQMRIEGNFGSAYFSVEEYKRPKFFVAFDTLKGSYALNEEVQVKGFAKAYAGNNIDGASVKYRVVRRARFPYFWCYYRWGMPSSPEMEITNGTAITKEDGSFDISFTTIPDKSVDPKTLPVFSYTVYADITDVNGETRSGNVGVNCGYRSLQINAAIAEDSKPQDLDTINIKTENLNGVFTPAKIKISIAQLKFPGLLRKRLWETPDQFVLTETEFRKAFPEDEYKDESNYLNWEKGKVLHEQTLATTADGKVNIPEATWYQNGWYVIEISGKDAQGNEILEKKYTHVWAPGKKEPNQKGLIAYADQDVYEPGEELELWVATGVDNPYLLKSSTNPYKETNPIKIKLEEKDRGGLAFSWLYVSNNRVYTENKTINIPWSNKDLQLAWGTHRDKLQPGAAEEWTLTIKGNKKEKVAAELLAGMYDASLDAFRPHSWNWSKLFPSVYAGNNWSSNYGFGIANGQMLKYWERGGYQSFDKRYDQFIYSNEESGYNRGRVMYANAPVAARAEMSEDTDKKVLKELEGNADGVQVQSAGGQPGAADETKQSAQQNVETGSAPQIRKNLQETAFFFPQMVTDANGNITFKFTMPEALTEWKMMAFAHTKDWKTGYLEGKVKTQKDLMVVPNLPRFLRQNDDIVISTKISNLSDKALNGEATLEILDATTLQPVNLPFRLKEGKQSFTVSKGQSTTANWNIHVPESMYTPVVMRIVAKAGNFSDGEENALPVITNRTLVTETLPMPVRGNEEKTFTLDKLLHQQSTTLSNHGLTVEFTGNPAWYAVQALPYLMEYPYECAEQTFNRFYANALAGHIVAQSPKVEQIFNQWKNLDSAALLSNLQKNEELKSALLQETPWVMEAKDESEQKRRIASLFETHKLARDLNKNLNTLEQMQLSEGGFPWFKGMQSDRYITQYIVTGIARLQHLNVKNAGNNDADKIVAKALPYLDRKLKEDYDYLVKNKINLEHQNINYSQIQYLYMRSFYAGKAIPAATQKAFDYYKKQAAKYWTAFNPYMEGQVALALHRMGDAKTPQQIIASLKETSINKEEMGMYWKNMPNGYWWYEAPIEAQSLLIETFTEVAKDDKAVDAMKVWLLKQKQTQNWKTTKATADACYALLLNGSDWLSNGPVVTINIGKETIKSTEIKTEAGTGYFKKKYSGQEVKNDMGTIRVKVETPNNKNEGVSWGAVYWQYFEDLDKITAAATPLSLKKQLFIERNSDRGPVLTEIKEGNDLKVGDKVKVRIELRVDRDMEYVHMKDMRAACFEPVNVLSQYKYQGGLGYYESTKDVSTNFFFDYLRKGTYVFEYPVFVVAKGNFSNGISTIQCMYAPEFSSHSEGIRVDVK